MATDHKKKSLFTFRRKHTNQSETATKKDNVEHFKKQVMTLFKVLSVMFAFAIIIITTMAIYLSTGGSTKDVTRDFYHSDSNSKPSDIATSSTETTVTESSSESSEKAPESSSSSTQEASTITVLAGEGPAEIAARAGISVEELQRLNPDHMTTGSWFAAPGDVVKIK